MKDLIEALKTINRIRDFGDAIYDVRERADMTDRPEGESSWDHPDVKKYSGAVEVVKKYIA